MLWLAIFMAMTVFEIVVANNRINDLNDEISEQIKLIESMNSLLSSMCDRFSAKSEFDKAVTSSLETHEELIKQLVIHTDGFEEK